MSGVLMLAGCGEVKVVRDSSPVRSLDPLNELVILQTSDEDLVRLECVAIESAKAGDTVSLQSSDRAVFDDALKAHLGPLNYPIKDDCDTSIQLLITEYRVRDLLVASRLIIDLRGEIRDDKNVLLWSASYRFADNAGSLPLDPISMGLGVVSAARNASEDSRHNGVYLAVRRLLRSLPEHQGLGYPSAGQGELVSSDGSFAKAMDLWGEGKFSEAVAMMQSLYDESSRSQLGYQYGLMLEATDQDTLAARVYADTAIDQTRNGLPAESLKTLRRLDRMNELNTKKHEPELARALMEIQRMLRDQS